MLRSAGAVRMDVPVPACATRAMQRDRIMPRVSAASHRLAQLATPHKWSLGGGRRVLWAPEFPLFLHQPGFWDPGTYLEHKLEGLLTWTLLDGGEELPWVAGARHWQPDVLTTKFTAAGINATERKSVRPDDTFASVLELRNTRRVARTLDLILWARVDATDIGEVRFADVRGAVAGIRGHYSTHDADGRVRHNLTLSWALVDSRGKATAATSWCVQTSEYSGTQPDWRLTPFYELFDGKLPDTGHWFGGIDERHGGRPLKRHVFLALHRRVRVGPGKAVSVGGGCRVAPRDGGHARARVPGWEGYFAGAPEFLCSDPYLERYFDYRLFGLRLNAIDHGRAPLAQPCVFEGINPGWFRHAISYSSQVLPKDLRWLHDPTLAQGCILNFLTTRGADGFIGGGLLPERAEENWRTEHMYHCDWGGAARLVYELHPDRSFLATCYEGLAAHAEWFDRTRDAERTGLYDVCSQAETGQEYMSRYLFADARADEWGTFRLKGVDATVYVYLLKRALAWMAQELGRPQQEAENWQARAAVTLDAVRAKMWDPQRRKFCDVHAQSGRRSPARALTDFYPFLCDLASIHHLPAIYDHLLNPKAFWTEWPAPSSALDEKLSDAYGRWRGKRMNCPWNGRTWLMTNSHIAEVLAHAALTLDPALEPYAAAFLTRTIHMLFVDRDLLKPTSYEYYNPLTGQAPFFRATDDYMHSYLIDLVIRYVVGLRPQADGALVIEPLQFGLKHFALRNCRVRGEEVEVTWDGRQLAARYGQRRQRVKGWERLVFERR